MNKKNIAIIIFGATGDLTKRKLIPALFKLYQDKEIKSDTPILCISRSEMSNNDFIKGLEVDRFIPQASGREFESFLKLIDYQSLDFSHELAATKINLKNISPKREIIFYLATPPTTFANISRIIEKTIPKESQMRIAFEKPFGYNLSSSRELHQSISRMFSEDQIYRVDHYLGKALVQDILLFRFSNLIYEQVWNNKFIDHIQITIAESLGVEYRAGYYDKTGAIKDMLQNHMMQLLSLTTMDEPFSFDAKDVRHEMAKVLKVLQLPKKEDVIIGQYSGDDNNNSYLQEKGVDPNSKTESYVALEIRIDNDKWKGVPIFVRTGKKLQAGYAEINIIFKDVSCKLFLKDTCDSNSPNVITIRIQPNTGIALAFNIKKPGRKLEIMPVEMDFCHHCLANINTPEAYEAILQAILNKEQTIFTSWDSIESSWEYIDHLLQIAKEEEINYYQPQSYGPLKADELLIKQGKRWINRILESDSKLK